MIDDINGEYSDYGIDIHQQVFDNDFDDVDFEPHTVDSDEDADMAEKFDY